MYAIILTWAIPQCQIYIADTSYSGVVKCHNVLLLEIRTHYDVIVPYKLFPSYEMKNMHGVRRIQSEMEMRNLIGAPLPQETQH